MNNKMIERTVDDALQILREGLPLEYSIVEDSIKLHLLFEGDDVLIPITIANCHLGGLDGPFCYFNEPVVLRNVKVGPSQHSFYASYFLAGLTIENCIFTSSVDFQCGGHNKPGKVYLIKDTHFHNFVNFYDCWFEGPVVIRGCHFEEGTNLLGNKGQPFVVTFDVPPTIHDNLGKLDMDGLEGVPGTEKT